MKDAVRLACRPEVLELPLADVLPMRLLDDGVKRTVKYRCIAASVRELGLIEPLVVFPQPGGAGKYILLDGHVRHAVLKDLGEAVAKCLVSEDDEGFTYNHKVNRLSAIQEHFMILRAIKSGVSEARIARALSVNVASIRQKRDLLDGICPEAVQLLRERRVPAESLRELRRVRPMRQIEVAELLCAAHNYSVGYARCLVAATSAEHLADGERAKAARGLSAEEVARMEHETESLGRDFRVIEESHGKNVLSLVIVAGYMRKLMENGRVARYLGQHHPEIHVEFQKLAEAKNLGEGPPAKGMPE